tara:strand:- start:102 stop:308 length:207 start_codon:yes stop_codon:yes gene_type:complete
MEIILFCYIVKKNFKMNLKERGLTVGDLTILLMIILFSFFIMNKIKESKNQKQITNFYQFEILQNKSK